MEIIWSSLRTDRSLIIQLVFLYTLSNLSESLQPLLQFCWPLMYIFRSEEFNPSEDLTNSSRFLWKMLPFYSYFQKQSQNSTFFLCTTLTKKNNSVKESWPGHSAFHRNEWHSWVYCMLSIGCFIRPFNDVKWVYEPLWSLRCSGSQRSLSACEIDVCSARCKIGVKTFYHKTLKQLKPWILMRQVERRKSTLHELSVGVGHSST